MKIKIAVTMAEKNKIYRLRYEVWVEELHIEQPTADHEHRLLEDPLDADGIDFYGEENGGCAGALRLNIEKFPPGLAGHFHLENFDSFRPKRFGYSSRFVLPPPRRGGLLAFKLFQTMCRHALQIDVPLIFCHGQPHIFELYRKVGFRRCGEDFTLPLRNAGIHTPMVLEVDKAFAKRSRSVDAD